MSLANAPIGSLAAIAMTLAVASIALSATAAHGAWRPTGVDLTRPPAAPGR